MDEGRREAEAAEECGGEVEAYSGVVERDSRWGMGSGQIPEDGQGGSRLACCLCGGAREQKRAEQGVLGLQRGGDAGGARATTT